VGEGGGEARGEVGALEGKGGEGILASGRYLDRLAAATHGVDDRRKELRAAREAERDRRVEAELDDGVSVTNQASLDAIRETELALANAELELEAVRAAGARLKDLTQDPALEHSIEQAARHRDRLIGQIVVQHPQIAADKAAAERMPAAQHRWAALSKEFPLEAPKPMVPDLAEADR